jgi:DNA (cytosine-5)-methyltransferase 1
MMSEPNLKRVEDAKERGGRQIGMLYKRGRPDGTGRVRQRAEIRFDGLAGCLRTPTGGSSRQTIVIIEEGTVKARLLSSREVGRLMGLPDTFRMPSRYNQAYQVAGDGVAVPVVRYLDEQFFRPFLLISKQRNAA